MPARRQGGDVQLENKLVWLNSPAAHYAANYEDSPIIPRSCILCQTEHCPDSKAS